MQRSMEKSFIYLILILSGHILGSIECSCRISMAELVKNDKGVESCVYIDKAGKRVEVNVNSTHRHTTDCEDCSCIQSGFLTCCGYGSYAGKIEYPSTCTLVKVGNCDYKLVLKSDGKTPCLQGPTTESVDAETHNFNQSNSTRLQHDPESGGGESTAKSRTCNPSFFFLFFLFFL